MYFLKHSPFRHGLRAAVIATTIAWLAGGPLTATDPAFASGTPDILWKGGGHIGVSSIGLTPDGSILASAGYSDHTIKLWSVADANLIRTIGAHYGNINALALSPDGTEIASTGEPVFGLPDDGVKVWRLSDGALLRTFPTGYQNGFSIAYSPDGTLLAVGAGMDVRIIRLSDGALVRTLTGHTWFVFGVAFSPNGATLATASGDNTIRLWRVSDGALVRTLTGHTGFVTSVDFSPNGLTLASGSFDETVRLWRVSDGTSLGVISGHTDIVAAVAWSPDGMTIASGSHDHTVKLWAFPSRALLRTLASPYTSTVAFTADGTLVGAGGYDGKMHVWNPADGTLLHTFGHHTGTVNRIAYAPDGLAVASISQDVTGKVWRASDGTEIAALVGHNDVINDVAISGGGIVATCAGSPPPSTVDPTIRFWSETDGHLIRILPGHADGTTAVDFHPNGATIASGGFDDRVRLWRVSDGLQIRFFTAGVNNVKRLDYSPDGVTIAVAGFSTNVKIWNPLTSTLIRTIALANSPSSIDYSPDGTMLVIGLDAYDNNVLIYRVSDGVLVRTLPGDADGFIHDVQFSPDGNLVASTSGYTYRIRLWQVSDGALLAEYDRETGWGPFPQLPLAFSPTGGSFTFGRADASVCMARNPFATATSIPAIATGGSAEGGVAFAARPNPFMETTDIAFRLEGATSVDVRILDVTGRVVRRIAAGRLDAGQHALTWDGRDAAGQASAPGLYFAEVVAAGRTIARGKVIRISPN